MDIVSSRTGRHSARPRADSLTSRAEERDLRWSLALVALLTFATMTVAATTGLVHRLEGHRTLHEGVR